MATAIQTVVPDVVMIHAKINGEQARALFTESDVVWLPDITEPRFDREPTGKAVFGEEGEEDVSLRRIWVFLRHLQFSITFASLRRLPQDLHEDYDRLTLRVVLTRGGETVVDPATYQKLETYVTELNWGTVIVWDNPPNHQGKCVDAVYLGYRTNTPTGRQLLIDVDTGWRIDHFPN